MQQYGTGKKMRRLPRPEAGAAQNTTRSRGSSRTSNIKLAAPKFQLKTKELPL